MPIHQLFPEPIYFSQLKRALTKKELKEINKQNTKTHQNIGNLTSDNTYVLENKTLKNLKKDLYKKVMDYFDRVVCTNNSIVPYITQSWLNYTTTNQFHHMHSHANSYLSGVFYVAVDDKVDKITFYKDSNSLFSLTATKFNVFNADSWWFPVKNMDVILFPSFLKHGVNRKKDNNVRIALSFNVFLKGIIGDRVRISELVIK